MSKKNSPAKVLFASLAGTTIEFFDFYIYANAAVLVFPALFFHASNPNTEMLQSLATFSIAFFARPLGSAFFGHFGDRIGRNVRTIICHDDKHIWAIRIVSTSTVGDEEKCRNHK